MAHAFKKSVPWGLCSLMPGVISVYSILYFSEVKKPFLFSILFAMYFLIGSTLLYYLPVFDALDLLKAFLEQSLVPLIKPAVDSFHTVVDSFPPPVWRFSICAYLVFGTVWALFLSKEYVLLGSPGSSRCRDLRLWIPGLLVPYLLIYLFV